MIRVPAMLAALLFLAGCQYPRDVSGTLDRISGGTLRAGVIEHPPFATMAGPDPAGVEVDALRAVAEDLDAEIEWTTGPEAELVEALHARQLDVVVGGLDNRTPYKKEVALTRPYVSSEVVLAARRGLRVPGDLEGVEVGVVPGTAAAAALAAGTEAVLVGVEDPGAFDGPVAVADYELDDYDLEPSGRRLAKQKHVLAVAMGENAWLTRLERYLLDHGQELSAALRREPLR